MIFVELGGRYVNAATIREVADLKGGGSRLYFTGGLPVHRDVPEHAAEVVALVEEAKRADLEAVLK